MNIAGSSVIKYDLFFFFCHRKMVIVHKTTVASVWFAHAKYLQIISKLILVSMKPIAKRGIVMIILFLIGFWDVFSKSATVNRALLKAVSPEVIGAATTPKMAKRAPNFPSREIETLFTTHAAFPFCATITSFSSLNPPKKLILIAAHTSATIASITIAP